MRNHTGRISRALAIGGAAAIFGLGLSIPVATKALATDVCDADDPACSAVEPQIPSINEQPAVEAGQESAPEAPEAEAQTPTISEEEPPADASEDDVVLPPGGGIFPPYYCSDNPNICTFNTGAEIPSDFSFRAGYRFIFPSGTITWPASVPFDASTTDGLTVQSGGTLIIEGNATFPVAASTSSGLNSGIDPGATLTVKGTLTLNSRLGVLGVLQIAEGSDAAPPGALNVQDFGSVVAMAGGLLNNPAGNVTVSGYLTVNAEGEVLNGGSIRSSGFLTNSGRLTNTGLLTSSGNLANLDGSDAPGTLVNSGTINSTAGTLSNSGLIQNSGSLTSSGQAQNGGTIISTGSLTNAGGLFVNALGSSPDTKAGALLIKGGTVTNNAAINNVDGYVYSAVPLPEQTGTFQPSAQDPTHGVLFRVAVAAEPDEADCTVTGQPQFTPADPEGEESYVANGGKLELTTECADAAWKLGQWTVEPLSAPATQPLLTPLAGEIVQGETSPTVV
ncbi:MAG: hypothetical protein LBH68_04370, partial [Bifidobacteriaceae bacterium]|nr:hypothetical protein [Bifidobacteriaceae bacterium]